MICLIRAVIRPFVILEITWAQKRFHNVIGWIINARAKGDKAAQFWSD
jgi:hypothetical protein